MLFVRKQNNGTIVLCGRKDRADGFLSNDRSQIYAFVESPISLEYPPGEVEEISLEQFMAEQKAPLEEKIQLLTDCILEMSETVYS